MQKEGEAFEIYPMLPCSMDTLGETHQTHPVPYTFKDIKGIFESKVVIQKIQM